MEKRMFETIGCREIAVKQKNAWSAAGAKKITIALQAAYKLNHARGRSRYFCS
jgi:hypothetical protein